MGLHAFDLNGAAVRARFEWALRNGNPTWLWPEVAVDAWQAIAIRIERIIRRVLTSGHSELELDGDPAAVSVAAFTSGMGPLLGHWMSEGRLTAGPSARPVLATHLYHNELRMQRMVSHAVAAVDGLAVAGIEACVLKGMHTAARYFPSLAVRPMSDIDLLIDPADEAKAALALHGMGFKPRGEVAYPERTWWPPSQDEQPRCLYFLHEAERWSIDLHLTLNLRRSTVMPWIRLDDTASFAGERWRHSSRGRVLGQPGQLLHLAVHAGVDLIGLTMLRLVELVFVIRQDTASGALRWDQFLAAAAQAGALGSAYPALYFCNRLVPGTVPPEVMAALRNGVPKRAARFLERLTPATVHRTARCSLEERFMWFPNRSLAIRQFLNDVLPLATVAPAELLEIYRMRAWRLLRRRVTL